MMVLEEASHKTVFGFNHEVPCFSHYTKYNVIKRKGKEGLKFTYQPATTPRCQSAACWLPAAFIDSVIIRGQKVAEER